MRLNCPFVSRFSPAASSLMPKQLIHVPALLSFFLFSKVTKFLARPTPEQSDTAESGRLYVYHRCYSPMYGRKLQKEGISQTVLVEESATVLPIELLIGGREGRSSQVPQILSSRLTNCCVRARPCVSAIKIAGCNYKKKKRRTFSITDNRNLWRC